MAMNRAKVVEKLVASGKFKKAEVENLTEPVLQVLEESLEKPEQNGDRNENKSADHGDKTIIENTPEEERGQKIEEISGGNKDSNKSDEMVTIPKEELTAMREAAQAFRAQQNQRKAALIKTLSSAQQVYSTKDLEGMRVEELEKMSKLVKVDNTTTPANAHADYSFSRGAILDSSDNDADKAPPVLSISERIRQKRA